METFCEQGRLGIDAESVESFKTRTRTLSSDRCAQAQKTARLVAHNFCTGSTAVIAACGHQFSTFVEKSCKHQEKIQRIDQELFGESDSPGRVLRYRHKEREFLASYQKSVRDKFPESCILRSQR